MQKRRPKAQGCVVAPSGSWKASLGIPAPANRSVSEREYAAATESLSRGRRLALDVMPGAQFCAQLLPFCKLFGRQDGFDPGDQVLADLVELRVLLSFCDAG